MKSGGTIYWYGTQSAPSTEPIPPVTFGSSITTSRACACPVAKPRLPSRVEISGFGYGALSRRTSLTRPNTVNTTYSYDNLSHLLSVTHAKGSTTLDGATYTVDNGG